MKTTLHLIVLAPDRVCCDADVSPATFPGVMGSFTVLPDHAPLVAALNEGTIRYTDARGVHTIETDGGFLRVENNRIEVCIGI